MAVRSNASRSFSNDERPNTYASTDHAASHALPPLLQVPPYVRFRSADDFDDRPTYSQHVMQPLCPNATNREELKKWARRPELHRDAALVVAAAPTKDNSERWRILGRSIGYVPPKGQALLEKSFSTEYNQPWRGSTFQTVPKKKEPKLIKSPFVPLFLRLAIIMFSVTAGGLAISILKRTLAAPNCAVGSSTYMALIVGWIGVAYTIFVAWDEWRSPPIGKRGPFTKLTLIFLDLFFIVFVSANVSVAFRELTDKQWACHSGVGDRDSCKLDHALCGRQKALSGMLIVVIIAWLAVFMVSIVRVVFRVSARGG